MTAGSISFDVDTDVVVVGGGPVGLASAIEARLAGLDVVLVEPRDRTIDKACGEGLMPGSVPLLARLGIDPPGMPLAGVSYICGESRAVHRFRSGQGRGVRRTVLHDALTARAEALGVRRVDARVTAFSEDAGGVTVEGMRARWVFGADGLHSSIRRLAGLDRAGSRPRSRYGLRQHFSSAPWSDLIEVHWAPDSEVYVTPVSSDTVGVAVLGPRGTDFDSALRGAPALAERLAGVAPASSLRGAGPFRQRAAHPSRGRVLLIGDAAGYVDAITGEGLRLGFEQARLAVEHVLRGRVGGGGYDRAWASATRDFRRLTSGLVWAANGPLRRAIVPAARALPGVYGAVVERLAS